MACGTQVVPGYKEFNAKMKQHGGKDPALEMKLDQMMGEKLPLFDHLVLKKIYPANARRKSVDKMTRKQLISHLDAMELPETDARDFDDNDIRDILTGQAPDMFMSSR
jgi:hypothetical protein